MLGEPVARALHQAGHDVCIFARSPAKARQRFGESYEIAAGDVTKPDTIAKALDDVDAVHLSLNSGPTPEDHDRIEHRGTAQVARLAAEKGIGHLTCLSGISARPQNRFFPPTAAKLDGLAAIKESGVPFTVFRPQWFFESLPLFVRGGRAVFLGAAPDSGTGRHRWHWLAVSDYARMVVRAYETEEAKGQVFDVIGPEPLSLPEALARYSRARLPGTEVKCIPFWRAKLLAALTRNGGLKHTIAKMEFWAQFEEIADPEPANRILGAPATTLDEWLARQPTGT